MARPRLCDRLDLVTPLTLVRAPAGFGKTTLVAQWLRMRPLREEVVAWLRVRPGGGDEATFWSSALQVVADAGLSVPPAVGNDSAAGARDRLERAVLTSAVPVVLVIDGFENVTSPGIDLALLDLLRHAPKLRLVVSLRSYRHFPAKRHLDLETTVLTAHDLRFTEDETLELLTDAGLRLPLDDVRSIVEESGGWPEPTRALALRLRASPELANDLSGVVQGIAADFLHERFLSGETPSALVEFALVTALPESFTRELAELLSEDDSTKCHLEALGDEGLLTTELKDGRLAYRWPSAARQALLDELRRRWPERLRGLHQRLARWCVDHEQVSQAFRHAVSATDWQLAISVIESSWRVLAFQHNGALYRGLSAIPTKFLMASPRALAVRDSTMRVRDNLFLTVATLPESPTELKALGRGKDAAEVLDTCLLVLLSWRLRGELDTAVAYGARALTIAEAARAAHSDQVSGLHPTLQLQVGITRLLGGELDAAIPPLMVAFERGADNPLGYVSADAASKLALAHAIVGDHAQAASWIDSHEVITPRRSTLFDPHIDSTSSAARLLMTLDQLELDPASVAHRRLASHTHREEFWPYVVYARAQYALTVGTPADALAFLDRARTARSHLMRSGAVARPLLIAAEADLLLALGRGNLARAVLAGPDREHPLLRVARARLALLAGQNDAALQITQDSSWDRIATGRDRLEMLLIRSVAAARGGDLDTAEAALRRAVDIARASGMLRPFTTVPREELLALAAGVPDAHDLLDKDPLAHQPELFPAHIQLIELSSREQQVLQQLADGLTVPQIADSAVLSYNTVRTQQRSLYKKLGTSDRSEAIARARQWGLLAPDRSSGNSDMS